MSLDTVIDLWTRLHSAGVVRWDHQGRAVEHIRYRSVVAQWVPPSTAPLNENFRGPR